jgi:hypothetical protein
MDFGEGVYGVLLTYRPDVVAKLESRGAVLLNDFLPALDRYLARIDEVPKDRVLRMYERVKRFYFEKSPDPARERIFLARLSR